MDVTLLVNYHRNKAGLADTR